MRKQNEREPSYTACQRLRRSAQLEVRQHSHHKTVLFPTLKPQKPKAKGNMRSGRYAVPRPHLSREGRETAKKADLCAQLLYFSNKTLSIEKAGHSTPRLPLFLQTAESRSITARVLSAPPPRSAAAVPRRRIHGGTRCRQGGEEGGRELGKLYPQGKSGAGARGQHGTDRPPEQESRGTAAGAGIPVPGAERGHRAEDANPYLLMGGDGHVAQRLRSAQLPRRLPRPARRRPKRKRSAAAAARPEEGAERRARPLPVADRARGGGTAHNRAPSAGAASRPGEGHPGSGSWGYSAYVCTSVIMS